MDREVALAALTLAVAGPALLTGAAWPQRNEQPTSARQSERVAWRALWMPVLPAAIAVWMLLGWATMEPRDAERLPDSLIGFSLLFGAIWLRALVRAGKAAKPRRSAIVAGTVGFWRPRIVLAHDFMARLDAHELAAVRAHEAMHVRHGDPLRIWLAQLATDLQWPRPGARRRFDEWRRVMELARDEDARRAGIDGADLASAVLVGAQMERAVPGGAALLGSRTHLEDRVARLLAPVAADTPEPPTISTRLAVAATCLVSAASGVWLGETLVQMLIRSLP